MKDIGEANFNPRSFEGTGHAGSNGVFEEQAMPVPYQLLLDLVTPARRLSNVQVGTSIGFLPLPEQMGYSFIFILPMKVFYNKKVIQVKKKFRFAIMAGKPKVYH